MLFLSPDYEHFIRDKENTDDASVASSVIRLLQIVRVTCTFPTASLRQLGTARL